MKARLDKAPSIGAVLPSVRAVTRLAAATPRQRVVVIGNMLETLVWFRGALMEAMVAQGHEVIACVPVPDRHSPLVARLEAMGVAIEAIFLDRTGLNPLADAYSACGLVARLWRLRPDVVLASMIKPVIYGSLAAHVVGVPSICSIVEGLGYTFIERRGRFPPRILVRSLYRAALAYNRRVFFLNPDDQRVFESLGLLRRPEQAVLLDGIGVDLDWFAEVPLPARVCFTLIARLIRDKGIPEYVAAARIVKARHPDVRFCLVGWIDENPSAIREDELGAWIDEGIIDYLGKLNDVRPALAQASVFVLPSYYPEGKPRSIMEAMAAGRPIITTDTPGCRETVAQGRNGFLVPARDVSALAEAMLRFVEQPDLIATMGRESRCIAEARYDVHRVNQRILEELELA